MSEEFDTIVGDIVEEKKCSTCDFALAGLGVLIGMAFLYISFDVMTGGRLTRMLGLGTARGDVDA